MQAATVEPAAAGKPRVMLDRMPVRAVLAGALLILISMFLKAVTIPSGVIFLGKTTYSNTGGGVLSLVMAIIALIFLVLARRRQHKGLLWGTLVFSVFAAGWSLINVLGGFTIKLVGGGSVHANSGIAPYLALAGGIIMVAGTLWSRSTARPAGATPGPTVGAEPTAAGAP